jgi:hypothetical protein
MYRKVHSVCPRAVVLAVVMISLQSVLSFGKTNVSRRSAFRRVTGGFCALFVSSASSRQLPAALVPSPNDEMTPKQTFWIPIESPLQERLGLEFVRRTAAGFFDPSNLIPSRTIADHQIDDFWNQVRAQLRQIRNPYGAIPRRLRYELRVNEDLLVILYPDFVVKFGGWLKVEDDWIEVLPREPKVLAISLGDSPGYKMKGEVYWQGHGLSDNGAMARVADAVTRAAEKAISPRSNWTPRAPIK